MILVAHDELFHNILIKQRLLVQLMRIHYGVRLVNPRIALHVVSNFRRFAYVLLPNEGLDYQSAMPSIARDASHQSVDRIEQFYDALVRVLADYLHNEARAYHLLFLLGQLGRMFANATFFQTCVATPLSHVVVARPVKR